MKILHVASEVAPLSQTGGLADVLGALPGAQARGADNEVAVVTPLYRAAKERAAALGVELLPAGEPRMVELGHHGFEVSLRRAIVPGAPPLYFVDAPRLYQRDGLYADVCQRDYPDNPLRFATLCRVALDAAPELLGGAPDVVHGHDWQAGLAPLMAQTLEGPSPATVFTVHNLAYGGVFPKEVMRELGLSWAHFTMQKLEFYDQASFLKAGISSADAVTTVSPSYAREIRTPEFGCGLDGFIRAHARRLTGIVNGIDTDAWNPRTDPALASNYGDLRVGKAACRAALAEELEVEVGPDELLIGVVSRFAEQKGLDLVADLAPELGRLGAHLIVLGTGDPDLEDRFRELSAQRRCPVTARVGFDVGLARRIYAGCDAMLMPSRFEPCGLNQLYAMRYGTVPIVHATGGLRDTVIDRPEAEGGADAGTGICFAAANLAELRRAVERAATLYRESPGRWAGLQDRGMARDSGWPASAKRYLALYRELQDKATA